MRKITRVCDFCGREELEPTGELPDGWGVISEISGPDKTPRDICRACLVKLTPWTPDLRAAGA